MVWIVRSTLTSVRRHHAKTVLHAYSFRTQHERDSTYRRRRDTIASVLQDLQVRFIEVLFKIWRIPDQSQYPTIQLIFCYLASTRYEVNTLLPTAREGNVFTGVCQSFCPQSVSWLLSRWLFLVMARSVRLLLECFLVSQSVQIKRKQNLSVIASNT